MSSQTEFSQDFGTGQEPEGEPAPEFSVAPASAPPTTRRLGSALGSAALGTALLQPGNRGAVGKEKVHAAVVVEVQRRHAAGHQFRLVEPAARSIVQAEVQAGLLGDLFE